MEISNHEADIDAQLRSVASLSDPTRHRLYRFVISQPEPVNREQAALGIGVAHHIAKFHLDKLADDGLLDVEYRRPAGRTGPGAGRPAKFYRRAERDILISLPERRYDLAGRLLADAITTSETSGVSVRDALRSAAYSAGRSLGARGSTPGTPRTSRGALLRKVCSVLEGIGYEPDRNRSGITLANCPFHDLAQAHTDLVCGMNLDLISGVLDSLGSSTMRANLDPADGRCCVTVSRSPAASRPVEHGKATRRNRRDDTPNGA